MSIVDHGRIRRPRPVASSDGTVAPKSIDHVSFATNDFVPPPSLYRTLRNFYREGGVAVVGAANVAFFSSLMLGASVVMSVVTMLAVLAVAAAGTITVPVYRRASSGRAGNWLLVSVGSLGFLALLMQATTSEMLSVLVTSFFAAALFSWGSAKAYAWTHRRTRTMLVGPSANVERLKQRWHDTPAVKISAECVWTPAPGDEGADEWVLRDVPRALRQSRADRVVIVGERVLEDPLLRHLAWGLQRAEIECLVVTDTNEYVEYLRPRRIGEQLTMAFEGPGDHLLAQAVKQLGERTLALILLIAFAPVFVVLAVAIKIDSRGPVIYRQERAGKDGIPFTMYKLRSMSVGADRRTDALLDRNEGAGPLFKMAEDPRVTKVGRFLRSTSLDEVPQLFNVLVGDMALIGPRPALERETREYSPWVWRRMHVRPGITGLWQVSGRSDLSWEESILLDLKYVNTWSLWLDVKIFFQTIGVVLARKGAR